LKRVLEEFCLIFGLIRYVKTPWGSETFRDQGADWKTILKHTEKNSEWKPMGGIFEHGYESSISVMAGNLQIGSIINC
jgi:hypothetical protein